MDSHFTLELANEAATLKAGRDFSKSLQAGNVVFMHGDLGAGKTTFVRGILMGLGYNGKVKSPTYTIVESYDLSQFNVYHFDLYRFVDPYEWDAAGFNEYFNLESICIIEWPEKAIKLLPDPDYDVELDLFDKEKLVNGRKLIISEHTST